MRSLQQCKELFKSVLVAWLGVQRTCQPSLRTSIGLTLRGRVVGICRAIS